MLKGNLKSIVLIAIVVCLVLTGFIAMSSQITDIDDEASVTTTTTSKRMDTFDYFLDVPTIDTQEYTPFAQVNNNHPFFSQNDLKKAKSKTWEKYSKLDKLERCGVAYANLTKKMMPTEERQSIGYIFPTGWHSVIYPKQIEDRFLYNRCHLIGFQLAGENDNPRNLITGTRYLNVTGMQPFENEVADYLKAHPKRHVLYRVTPIFVEDDLLARGVLMEAKSVEDDDIEFCVFVYNIQPGILIEYEDGSSAALLYNN